VDGKTVLAAPRSLPNDSLSGVLDYIGESVESEPSLEGEGGEDGILVKSLLVDETLVVSTGEGETSLAEDLSFVIVEEVIVIGASGVGALPVAVAGEDEAVGRALPHAHNRDMYLGGHLHQGVLDEYGPQRSLPLPQVVYPKGDALLAAILGPDEHGVRVTLHQQVGVFEIALLRLVLLH
jgi:hypothetical protein